MSSTPLSPELQSALATLAQAGVSPSAFGATALELFGRAAPSPAPLPSTPAHSLQPAQPAPTPIAVPALPRSQPRRRPKPPVVDKRLAVVKVMRPDGVKTTACIPWTLLDEAAKRLGGLPKARQRVKALATRSPSDVRNLSGWIQEELVRLVAQDVRQPGPARQPDLATGDLFAQAV